MAMRMVPLLALATLAFAQTAGPVAKDPTGATHTPLDGKGVVCLIFVLDGCPIANKYAPEMNRIAADYSRRGVRFYLVHADPKLTSAEAATHAKEFGLKAVTLLDPQGRLLRAADAKRSPCAVLYDGGALRYHGRIDDRFTQWGVQKPEPKTRDLRNALDAVLADKPVLNPRTEVVGCILKGS